MTEHRAEIQAEFYVTPSGDDRQPGTEAMPLATPQRARDAVRAINREMTGDIVVNLMNGRYRLEAPLVLEARDSGTNGHRVIYRGPAGAPAILDGGMLVSGWKPSEHGRWTAAVDLPAVRQLYVNGRRAERTYMCSAWGDMLGRLELMEKGEGYWTESETAATLIGVPILEFVYRVAWAHTRCLVAEVRRSQGRYEIIMKQPEFLLALKKEGVQLNGPVRIEGAPVDFRGPCLWWFDPAHRLIHYMPNLDEDKSKTEFVVPRLEKLLDIRGTVAEPVRNIIFENVAFEHATWLEPGNTGFVDIQANFRMTADTPLAVRPGFSIGGQTFLLPRTWDCVKSPANVTCHAGHGIVFDRCRFQRLGGAGLDIERGSTDVRVVDCEFSDISGSGIQVADVVTDDHHPDDARKSVRDVEISGCRIHHVAVEFKGGIGVFVGYARNVRVIGNIIHHLPYSAVSIGWGWGELDAGGGAYPVPDGFCFAEAACSGGHLIENNDIHDVMREMDDGGAIYTLGRMPGTVIRGNRIRDSIGMPGGIYLDEGSADIRVENNVIDNVPRAMNLNNRNQDRHKTCSFEGNVCDAQTDVSPARPKED